MSNKNTLDCDYCGEEHRYTPIIKKPKRFGFKGNIFPLAQINTDGREVDNICINCLENEIENIKHD